MGETLNLMSDNATVVADLKKQGHTVCRYVQVGPGDRHLSAECGQHYGKTHPIKEHSCRPVKPSVSDPSYRTLSSFPGVQ